MTSYAEVVKRLDKINETPTLEKIYPTAHKTMDVLVTLLQGKRLTVGVALQTLGVYALSQECGRLRKLGWPIQDRRIEVSPGVWVKEYYL